MLATCRNLSFSFLFLLLPPSFILHAKSPSRHIFRCDLISRCKDRRVSIVSYLARLTTNIRSGPIPLQRISTGGEYVTSHYPHCWVRQKYGHVTWLNPVVGVIWRHLFLLYKNSLEENWITFSDSVSIPFL